MSFCILLKNHFCFIAPKRATISLDLDTNSESCNFSEHPTLSVPQNTQDNELDNMKSLNPKLKIEVDNFKSEKFIEKPNENLNNELLFALDNLSSIQFKTRPKRILKESQTLPDQIAPIEFTPEQILPTTSKQGTSKNFFLLMFF